MSGTTAPEQTRVAIECDRDIVEARQQGRAMVRKLGFSPGSATLVATAISELARNILLYAGRGEIVLQPVENGSDPGLVVLARDQGPGIQDVRRALEDGYSTSGRLGLGLPGVRRLMDELEIAPGTGGGTVVRAVKWRNET
jgi:serine/threonine-protein kinase RsbT